MMILTRARALERARTILTSKEWLYPSGLITGRNLTDGVEDIAAALLAAQAEAVKACAKAMDAESLPRPARIIRALLPKE